MTTEERNSLAVAASCSLHFCERIRQVRDPKVMVAAGTLGELFPGSESGDLPELEATFLRSGDEMQKLLEEHPGDPDITEALLAHDGRKTLLGL
jgi:hypothetical protein